MPVLVATDKLLVKQGEPVVVTFHSPGVGGERVGVVPAGAGLDEVLTGQPAGSTGTTNGSVVFQTGDLPTAAYDAVLSAADGQVLARAPFWVGGKDGTVRLTTSKSTYTVGEPIGVGWKDAPANRWDWIGVYRASAADPNTDYYLIWQYTGGAEAGTVHGMPSGSLHMDGATTQGSPWPLPPGKYVVYYLLADAYTTAAKASFTVAK